MKILVHHRIASRDGQWVHLSELTKALADIGHEVVVVGPRHMHDLAFGGEAGLVAGLKRALPAAVYELLELGYNLVAFPRLARAVRRHRPDVLYERYNLFLLAGVWVRRLFRLPLLLEVNGPLYEERARYDRLALHRLARWAERKVWNGADAVLPVTGVLGRMVQDAGVPSARIQVIPNGIDPARFAGGPGMPAAKARLGLDGRLVLGFTGFVKDWHGLDTVVSFLAVEGQQWNLHLLIVGDGPARAGLERQAAEAGVSERLTVTGIIGPDAIPGHVAAFDIALQPGVTAYASPLKLFEYMALGRATVAPASANIREVLTDGYNALLFDPGRPGAMTEAVRRLCRDPGLRQRLGAAAAATLEIRGLTWRHNAERVAHLGAALCEDARAAKKPA